MLYYLLIHSADPQYTQSLLKYQYQAKITASWNCELAKWIIDGTPVLYLTYKLSSFNLLPESFVLEVQARFQVVFPWLPAKVVLR